MLLEFYTCISFHTDSVRNDNHLQQIKDGIRSLYVTLDVDVI